MIEFRDRIAKEKGIEMLEYINQDGVKQGINPFDHGSAYTDIMKTQALKQRSTNTAYGSIWRRPKRRGEIKSQGANLLLQK